MKKEYFYTVEIYGQKAVDAGYKFCAGKCYNQIAGGRGQLEVTVDDDGETNGFAHKWVSVSFIKNGADIPVLLDELKKVGFSGCWCCVEEEILYGDYSKTKELFATKI